MDTHSKERGKILKRGATESPQVSFAPLKLPLTGRRIEMLRPTQNHLEVHVAG